jgi:hypothetical protein
MIIGGTFTMKSVFLRALGPGGILISALLLSVSPSLAGIGAPAPLIGVTGPVGIVAAGVAYGGYLLFRRYRNRS